MAAPTAPRGQPETTSPSDWEVDRDGAEATDREDNSLPSGQDGARGVTSEWMKLIAGNRSQVGLGPGSRRGAGGSPGCWGSSRSRSSGGRIRRCSGSASIPTQISSSCSGEELLGGGKHTFPNGILRCSNLQIIPRSRKTIMSSCGVQTTVLRSDLISPS